MSKNIAVTLEVTNNAEARELQDAWQEIVMDVITCLTSRSHATWFRRRRRVRAR